MLSCTQTSSNKTEKLLHLVGWFIWTLEYFHNFPSDAMKQIRRLGSTNHWHFCPITEAFYAAFSSPTEAMIRFWDIPYVLCNSHCERSDPFFSGVGVASVQSESISRRNKKLFSFRSDYKVQEPAPSTISIITFANNTISTLLEIRLLVYKI